MLLLSLIFVQDPPHAKWLILRQPNPHQLSINWKLRKQQM